MLNFLRKIRRKEMNGKYLKYAIGEIVLVVIGILIALSISSLNQDIKDTKEERIYLKNIKRDIMAQIAGVERNIRGEKSIVENLELAEKAYNFETGFQISQTSLRSLTALSDRFTFNLVNPTYKELLSTGKIELISDQETKDKLMRYYENLELWGIIIQKNNDTKDFSFLPQLFTLFEMAGVNSRNVDLDNPRINSSFDGYNTPARILRLISVSLKKPENELALLNLIRFGQNVASFNLEACETIKTESHAKLP
jgi:hypothetical protein